MQKRNQKRLSIVLLAMALCSVTFFSFSVRPGGDHFEVYLNKKLVFQQFVTQTAGVKTFSLDQSHVNDQVDIFYSHCGKIGNKRTIVIKDGKNVLKQWRFADIAGKKYMSVGAKEIIALQIKNGDSKLSLYYSSEQLPEGRLLAAVILNTDDNKAMP